jgi:UDP-glucuronate decarboxylase
MTGSSSKIIYLPLPTDDPRQRRPDITAAKRDLDWTPDIALAEGLTSTIAYFERELSSPVGEFIEAAQ